MWKRIVELEPVIAKCARHMAWVYQANADELAGQMRLALAEKSRRSPRLLNQDKCYIFHTLCNVIHSSYRRQFGASLQYHLCELYDESILDDEQGDALNRVELIETVQDVLENCSDEMRRMAQAILENYDEIVREERVHRPARLPLNVSMLAEKLGLPKSTAYYMLNHLRRDLAPALAA